MIFIAVKWTIKPEYADRWPELSREFTQATRNEPGNIFFEWSKSLEEENTYQLVEAFQDDAGGDHVNSDHFKKFVAEAPDYVAETPKIVSVQGVDGNGWGEMGEVQPR
ncbi:putative quinol monooxygenase [Actinomycetospora soli]|uniref:putative quinol monooxygenase n=1 Tax=Actinomycetospora soli TaxID=2893887 RepID=UPI001E4009CD|nr:putative quinol monooxygenase [Actinomycetospora soli]MCD2188895.1 antibiotic biosynthesis monooxygenase [Actinomycetospora soli]